MLRTVVLGATWLCLQSVCQAEEPLVFPNLDEIGIGLRLMTVEDFKEESRAKALPSRKGMLANTGNYLEGEVTHGDLITKIDGELIDGPEKAAEVIGRLKPGTQVSIEIVDFSRNSKGQGVWRGTRKVSVTPERLGTNASNLMTTWKTGFLDEWHGYDPDSSLFKSEFQYQRETTGQVVGMPMFQFTIKDGVATTPVVVFRYLGNDLLDCQRISVKVGSAVHDLTVESKPKRVDGQWSEVFVVPAEGKAADAVLDLAFGSGEAAIMFQGNDEVKSHPISKTLRAFISIGVMGYNERGGKGLWKKD